MQVFLMSGLVGESQTLISFCGHYDVTHEPLENSILYFWESLNEKGNFKVKYKFVPEYQREK